MAASLWYVVSLATVGSSPVGLRLNVVSNLEQSYADHGSGAAMDLFTWQPSCSPETHAPSCSEAWMSLGHVASSSEATRGTAIVALAGPADPHALAKPISLALNWNTLLNGKSKGTSGGVFTAICPSGYAALGSVAIEHDIDKAHEITPALFPNLRCLRKKYLKPGGQLRLLWDSKPTRFDTPCSVWTQPPEAYQHHPEDVMLALPMLGGQQSFNPPNSSFEIDFTAGVEVTVPPPPPCGSPPLPACPPCGDQGTGLPPCVCPAPKPGPSPACMTGHSTTPCIPPHCDSTRSMGTDSTTQGAWQTKYGKAGFHMFGGLGDYNHSEYLPAFVKRVAILAPGSSSSSDEPSPAPCPSTAPGFTNCSAMTFENMCIAADTPGCCHWCRAASSQAGHSGICLPHSRNCSAVLPLPMPPRLGRWSAMPTAMDPRALSFPTPGVYRSLGFVATTSPESGNASFEIAVDIADASKDYILSIYAVDFEGDSCSCTHPPSCCKEIHPAAQCIAGPARMQTIEILDRSTGALVAPAQHMSNFTQGQYLRFKLRGSVVLRVSQRCSQRGDAMVNALFWDEA